jgi:hypothetical protein
MVLHNRTPVRETAARGKRANYQGGGKRRSQQSAGAEEEREFPMKPLPHTAELETVARHTVWFKKPAEALEEPFHLVAHVLTYGTHEDVMMLEQAPPGIFDPRSWAYWNLKIGRYPAPPLPQRSFSAPPL